MMMRRITAGAAAILAASGTPVVSASHHYISIDQQDDYDREIDLWTRGAIIDTHDRNPFFGAWQRFTATSKVRRQAWLDVRGGALDADDVKLMQLGQALGPKFMQAIEQNRREHQADCEASCKMFYCSKTSPVATDPMVVTASNTDSETASLATTVKSYSLGAVPPEDFASEFGFPLDLIKVTQEPLFSLQVAARVIHDAQAEGVDQNEYTSGKYKLGGDWLLNLPSTRLWFNEMLETTLFPLVARLFPEIISSTSVLRAHSVSLLKYNSSHPRTDIHIDNGVLAMTIAMTPTNKYSGGGTYFEHMGKEHVLEMDVGYGTFRPGSVRHGGHRVTNGDRYILGAFLLLTDKVEHVRRLKNRGNQLRKSGDLQGAAQLFEWALEINPRCCTCLKDWAEILQVQQRFPEAEEKLRKTLGYVEGKDSDALFTLGVVLSAQGRNDEAIEVYKQALELNEEDAELCFNLGMKLGAKGDSEQEVKLYEMATKADPKFGGAWLNWGIALAEKSDFDGAETLLLKAMFCGGESAAQAIFNLALVYYAKADMMAQAGDVDAAKANVLKATQYAAEAQPFLTAPTNAGRWKQLKMACHKLTGKLHAFAGDLKACEDEYRRAVADFPGEAEALNMLYQILHRVGNKEEADVIMEQLQKLVR